MKTTLISTITLFTLSLFTILLHSDAENPTKWVFPEVVVVDLGKGDISGVTYSPDGSLFAVLGLHGIWLCDADTGEEQVYLTGHDGPINSVSFSPDGKTIASGSDDKTVRLWNLDTQTEITTLRGHDGPVNSVSFSPDGKTIASGSDDKTVRLWNLDTQTEIVILTGHRSSVNSVSFNPDDETTIASGSDDKTVRLWNLDTQTEIVILTGHRSSVNSVSFSPDGETIASASRDETVRLWNVDAKAENVDAKAEIATLKHPGSANSVVFSPDGKTIASGTGDSPNTLGWEGTVHLWNIDTKTEIATLIEHTDHVNSVSFSPDGKTIASGSDDKTVCLWNINTKTKTAITILPGGYQNVSLSPDWETLASGGFLGKVLLWNVDTKTEIATLTGPRSYSTNDVNSVSFSPDGETIASGGEDKTVRLWNIDTQTEIATLRGHDGPVNSVSFSPDGETIASASDDGTVRLWNVDTQTETAILTGHRYGVHSVSFSPTDETTIASGGRDETVRLWNLDTQSEIATLRGHDGPVNSVSFSPDGETIASGSHDRTVRLWNLDTQTEIATLVGHTGAVNSVSFSRDGEMLASGGGYDRTVRLWNLDTKIEVATLVGHIRAVNSVSFSSDGETIASFSYGKMVLWKIPPYLAAGEPTLPSTESDLVEPYPIRTFNVDLNADGVVSPEEDNYVLEFISENDLFLAADVNTNNKVDGDDDDIVVEILDGREPFEVGNVNSSADVNGDGKVTVTDLQLVRFALKLDVNRDGLIDRKDVNDITVAINVSNASLKYDVNGDGVVNDQDQVLINTVVKDPMIRVCPECPFSENLISDVAFTPDYTFFVLHPQFVTLTDASVEDFPFKYTITLSQESREPLPHFMFPLEPPEPIDKSTEFIENTSKMIVMELVGLTPYGKAIGYANKVLPVLIEFVNTLEETTKYVPPDPQVTMFNYYSEDTDTKGVSYPILFVIPKQLSSVNILGIQEYYEKGSWVKIQEKIDSSQSDESNVPWWVKIAQGATGWIVEGFGNLLTGAINFFNNEILGNLAGQIKDPIFRSYNVSWDLKETFLQENPGPSAPRAQPMSLADYPPFQQLSPEMQEYLLRYLGESTNPKAITAKAWQIPEETSLLPNYPNPFNPETWIPYQLSKPADVTLTIYNINGHVVRTLDLGYQRAGTYHGRNRAAYWDGKNDQGEPIASGIYFYMIKAGDFTATRKMLIRK